MPVSWHCPQDGSVPGVNDIWTDPDPSERIHTDMSPFGCPPCQGSRPTLSYWSLPLLYLLIAGDIHSNPGPVRLRNRLRWRCKPPLLANLWQESRMDQTGPSVWRLWLLVPLIMHRHYQQWVKDTGSWHRRWAVLLHVRIAFWQWLIKSQPQSDCGMDHRFSTGPLNAYIQVHTAQYQNRSSGHQNSDGKCQQCQREGTATRCPD